MINKIAHAGDIHIRKVPTRNEEYDFVFNNLYKSLKQQKPDRIVIVGDLVNDYIDLQGEQLILAAKLLNNLAKIAPVRITRGNHDYLASNSNRTDAISAIVETISNPNIEYYNKTGFFYDENVIWAVWHHGDKNNNPWKRKEGKELLQTRPEGTTIIDLFHDPIYGSKTMSGFEMKKNTYYKKSDLKGDYSLLSDIHLQQFFDDRTKGYSSSLISQNFGEGDFETKKFHGYLLWDINKKNVIEIPINNDWSFNNITITQFTDFDDLDFEIENPTKHMKVRFIWKTLPSTRNNDNERKLREYVLSKYSNITISNKNEFIINDNIDIDENTSFEDITQQSVQHEIFREYLDKLGVEEKMINDIIALDDEIVKKINIEQATNIEWDVVKFGGENFKSYEKFDINWKDMNGLFQVSGKNTGGKSTLFSSLPYVLFSKTLETEKTKKFGDVRFINNKLDVNYCSSYVIIEANGEYFGVKRKTTIEKNRSGEITGCPTKVSYHLLSSPDDEINDENSIENLTDGNKNKTQKRVVEIIGTYDNFMRVVLTTSDTLNKILSNDMAEFIDAILFDSGLDIFDSKVNGLKQHIKDETKKERVTCSVELKTKEIKELEEKNILIENEIKELKTNTIPQINEKIKIGENFVEELTKKLHNIDQEIVNLDVEESEKTILTHDKEIDKLKSRKSVLLESTKILKETYDSERLKILENKKDEHKQKEYNIKLEIKEIEKNKGDEEHKIEIINGKIFLLKEDDQKKKDEIKELKESKICPTCGQELTKEHKIHIDDKIKSVEIEMFSIADKIKAHQGTIQTQHNPIILGYVNNIKQKNEKITELASEMESVLIEIGNLTNDKNDVEKRKILENEISQIPIKIQNEELKKTILKQKIDQHKNSIKQIEENEKINKGITAGKNKLFTIKQELNNYLESVINKNNDINNNKNKINEINKLISDFKEQEYQDSVYSYYKKCVHRDGIPKQLLINNIIPRINLEMENVLASAQFRVWLDADDLKLKLAYYNTPNAIIDAIGASGKERTFASIVLKMALNAINVKSKPMLFLLDEVMGKLDAESVDEFVQMLHIIKEKYRKFLIIEHNHNVSPDYVISVSRTEDGISSAELL
jgi:DNA repair exonuclease SbcCD ATPase subunit